MRIFHEKTTSKNPQRPWRILIIDGHKTHIQLRTLEYAYENKILCLCLPPHSTHLMQPLDVGIFSVLQNVYSQMVQDQLDSCHGICTMGKRDFWRVYKHARGLAFTKATIRAAFRAAGIYPSDRKKVLEKIRIR